MRTAPLSFLVALLLGLTACRSTPKAVEVNRAAETYRPPQGVAPTSDDIQRNARTLFDDGRKIFRDDTFGSEAYWGGQLRLHEAIIGRKNGGVGVGITPVQALKLGLKVDVARVPALVVDGLKKGTVNLESADTTVALLKANAIVGVVAVQEKGQIVSMGVTCALCHSTVDDSFTKGIGRRLDGWPNRDLDIGQIVASAPNLKPLQDQIGVDEDTLKKVLTSWGPGRYDAELTMDGKASGPTLIPAAFGLAGQNLHTYAGWGSIPYWNAYVANTQMHGKGTFVDGRLNDKKFPLAQKNHTFDKRDVEDLITSKLPALQFYQLAIPAPTPPEGSYDERGAARGATVFAGKARCAQCHVLPLFSEPGWPMHKGAEIGIDDIQASRSPDGLYRTTPLAGLFARAKGGYYHDGRFKTLDDVVAHYEKHLKLDLSGAERADLLEYLKSL